MPCANCTGDAARRNNISMLGGGESLACGVHSIPVMQTNNQTQADMSDLALALAIIALKYGPCPIADIFDGLAFGAEIFDGALDLTGEIA